MITEAQIEDDVRARLDDDPRIAASSEITMSAVEDEVTLAVSSPPSRNVARR